MKYTVLTAKDNRHVHFVDEEEGVDPREVLDALAKGELRVCKSEEGRKNPKTGEWEYLGSKYTIE